MFNKEAQQNMKRFFLQKLAPLGDKREYQKGQILDIDEEHIYIVCSGYFKQIAYHEGGREITFFRLDPGTLIGEMNWFESTRIPLITMSLERGSVISRVSSATIEKCLKENPERYRYFIHSITRKYNIVMLKYQNLALNDSRGRLASFLLSALAQHSDTTKEKDLINYAYTHQEIAKTIGISRITVSKVLKAFQEEGLIEYNNKYIRILKPQRLSDSFRSFW